MSQVQDKYFFSFNENENSCVITTKKNTDGNSLETLDIFSELAKERLFENTSIWLKINERPLKIWNQTSVPFDTLVKDMKDGFQANSRFHNICKKCLPMKSVENLYSAIQQRRLIVFDVPTIKTLSNEEIDRISLRGLHLTEVNENNLKSKLGSLVKLTQQFEKNALTEKEIDVLYSSFSELWEDRQLLFDESYSLKNREKENFDKIIQSIEKIENALKICIPSIQGEDLGVSFYDLEYLLRWLVLTDQIAGYKSLGAGYFYLILNGQSFPKQGTTIEMDKLALLSIDRHMSKWKGPSFKDFKEKADRDYLDKIVDGIQRQRYKVAWNQVFGLNKSSASDTFIFTDMPVQTNLLNWLVTSDVVEGWRVLNTCAMNPIFAIRLSPNQSNTPRDLAGIMRDKQNPWQTAAILLSK